MKSFFFPIMLCVLCIPAGDLQDRPAGSRSGGGSFADASLAVEWYQLELHILKNKAGYAAPVNARVFGYTGIILYESLVGGMSGLNTLSAILGFRKSALPAQKVDWIVCANAAMAFTLKHLTNPDKREVRVIDSLQDRLNKRWSTGTAINTVRLSGQLGQQISQEILQWAEGDGGAKGYLNNFTAAPGPDPAGGHWLPSLYDGALLPSWGNNRPFLKVEELVPAPIPYSDLPGSRLYKEALDVYNVSNNLTAGQSDIARFWADAQGNSYTPAGHTINILNQLLTRGKYTLGFASIAYAKLGIALNDAFIYCWRTKYHYNYIRPIHYIRRHFKKDWIPFLNTPSFPEYTSGHSVQAAASAEVLSDLFGKHYPFTDHTEDTLGYTPRTFNSFESFAREAAMSRLYGGIHFRNSIEKGLLQGKWIGNAVNRMDFGESSSRMRTETSRAGKKNLLAVTNLKK
jgi:hypothetical protein